MPRNKSSPPSQQALVDVKAITRFDRWSMSDIGIFSAIEGYRHIIASFLLPERQHNLLSSKREHPRSFSGAVVRYRTAAVLSVALIGGMFAVPSAIMAVFLPTLNQGIPDPLPGYEHILLAVAAFFLTWRFLLALPIAFLLFTVAAFTSASTGVNKHGPSPRRISVQPMNRPVGITVIASLNILGGFTLGVSEMFSAHRPEGALAWILALGVILSLGLGVALLRLQNWARAVVVVLYGMSLISIPGQVIFAHDVVDVLAAVVPGSYLVWAVWYMHRSQVKAAFGRA